MLEAIEKLLILQDRDRSIFRLTRELEHIPPERLALQTKAQSTQSALEAAKVRVKELETRRRDLEVQVEGKKQQIEKYSIQQFQTKKNEEYRAIGREIDSARAEISKFEDAQLELMEQIEAAQKESAAAAREAGDARKLVEDQFQQLAGREESLKKELGGLKADREQLAEAVDEAARGRYERLLKGKGATAVVGVDHGVCGGCHMRLPPQILLQCRADEQLVTCPNCARLLYYTRDMDLAVVD